MRRLWLRPLAGALLALGAAGALAGCSSDADKRARHETRAEEFLSEGKPREALIELRSALKIEPKNAPLHFRIAQVLESLGDLKDALFFYQESLRLAPEDSRAALAVARLLLFEEPDRSAELIEGVLARNPDDANAYIRRSELALARGNAADALRDAQLAVEKAPKSHMAHFQEGLVHRARVRERKLRKQPEDPQIYADALKAFDEGLAVAVPDAPTNEIVSGALERAFVLSEWTERRADAGPAYRSALELAKERESLVEQVRVLREAQRYGQRVGDAELERWALETQIALDPRRYSAWARLAGIEQGDAVLKRLIETLPDDERAHALYARILWDRGRQDEALAHLREVEGRVADPIPLRASQAEFLIERERLDDARGIVLALQQEHPDRPETLEVVSLLAARERRYSDAVGVLRRLLERRETARAQQRLAECEYRLRNYAPALVAVNRALEISSANEEQIQMLRLKARIESAARDPEAALLTLRRLRRLRGGTLSPYDVPTVARALYQTKRSDVARVLLKEALTSDEVALGTTLLYVRHEAAVDPEGARAALERALERYPTHPALLHHLARADFEAGQGERAAERVAAAVAAHPNHAQLYRLQAMVLASLGRPADALPAAERALELDPELPELADMLVSLLSQLGRREEAVERLERQAKDGKLAVSGRILLARLHLGAGGDARAIELLESALAERADLPGAKNDLAYLIAKQGGDLERARRLAEEARAALPRSAEVADTMGYVYLKKGLADAAVDQFMSALELAPERSPAWASAQFHLGLSYKALGRKPEARLAFERALAAAVEFPEAADARREIESLAQANPPS